MSGFSFFGFMCLLSYCSFDLIGGVCLHICELCFYHTQQCPLASLPCLPPSLWLDFQDIQKYFFSEAILSSPLRQYLLLLFISALEY